MNISEEIKISDNGFVFNSRTGESFSLNPMGLEIIKLIAANNDFDDIRKSILKKYDVNELTFEKDFYDFYAMLKHHQLMVQGNPMDFI